MAGYWVMRTDKDAASFLWQELEEGRLRQGWGHDPSQNLDVIASQLRGGQQLTSDQAICWRGNRRMLPSEADGIRQSDVVIVPHLPRQGSWSVVRVNGPYRFEIAESERDYGHILPVELLTARRPVNPYEEAVSARLRQTMRTRIRLWNIDQLGPEVEAVVAAVQSGRPADAATERLPMVVSDLEGAAWASIQRQYQGAEFERPCVMLLEALYGEDNVEHTGGTGERGADAVCRYVDPLGVKHGVAAQIKMWEWDAAWTRPLEQIREAYSAYEGITAGAIMATCERATPEFENARTTLEKELGIPIRLILRRELLHLLIAHLPQIVVDTEEGSAAW